ncbi:gliding motility-associated C-terminal domain-containing protein [Hymenobacter tibetensis]|uniref:Gliding motility-associated C-terminal domain-containing protein n=1 Tax=Hymenobacter tibetensis TaxID=497967 RepID=A0ABY4D3B3_9BACT|nr:gliding motility-associated C-terminal domain-containing protein [Hymenobacter tibetensis]UOG76786.1 gliding motility-associated C-terminal domain-containing protein [Hymenobacter tibetensis]
MPFVKSLLFWLLLSPGLLLPAIGWAQTCPVTPNPPTCTFEVIDVQSGTPVQRLCVGREVRFTPCSSRNPSFLYSYQVVPGNGVLPNPCGPDFVLSPVTYRPTQAGTVTIVENSQAAPGATPTIFFRVFEVSDSPAPAFTVAACAQGLVQVRVPGSPYTSYAVQIGSGAPVAAAPNAVVTYPVPAGATSVTVTGRYTDNTLCTNSATQPIVPLAPLASPTIQNITLQGTTVQLTTTALTAGYRYVVERETTAGVYQAVPSAVQNSATSLTVPSAQPGRYRLRAADDCTEELRTSAPLSTLTLTVAAAERRNQLTWQLPDNPASYELTRNGTPIAVALSPADRAYADTAVACGVQYSYRLTARYSSTVTSVSDMLPIRATATQPPATPRLFATFDLRNRVVLTANVARFPTTGQLTYLSDARTLVTTPNRTVRDSSLTRFGAGAAPCFQVRFVDDCGNRSADSAPFCPALLTAEQTDYRGSTIRLGWSVLRGVPAATPTDSLRYRLLVLNPDNTVLRSIPVSSRGAYIDVAPPTDQQQVRYRLEVTGAGLSAPSYSNIASVTRRVEAFVPTAFTPNGDGLNDVLEIKGRFLNTFRFTVVDRNGQEVFQSTNRSQTWDGRVRNAPPVPGSFVWRFEATDEAGQTVVQRGTVTILK